MILEVKVPPVGESITEVTIASWLKKDGDMVETDEIICELDSDKATFELTAEKAGKLQILSGEGETVAVGAVVAKIDTEAVGAAAAEPPATKPAGEEQAPAPPPVQPVEQPAPAAPPSNGGHKPRVSPVASKILAEAHLSAEAVTGTGPGGKITKDDALRAAGQGKDGSETTAAPVAKEAAPPAAIPPAQPAGSRNERREKLSTLRRTIARRLVAAKNETAMLTTFNEADMSAIMALRKQYKDKFKDRYEVNLGFMSFFTRAVCIALSEFSQVNAFIDGDSLIFHDYCDIGIAVSTDRGLVVPIIRNAESLSLAEIESEVLRLATRARNNQLTIEEMTGGTFTITNGGVFGSLMSTPILNTPQSAILGMHKIMERPVAVNGEIVIRPMMYLAVSYDHRVIDGKESVSFLVRIKELLEDPSRMLLKI